jgi:large subunit ribosomal protein L15
MKLNQMKNSSRPSKRRKRLGRGMGSNRGKTCCRGVKGAGARSGWKSRARYEGGQLPLYRRLPVRGFTRGRFLKRFETINLSQIDAVFNDGDTVSIETLRQKGFLKGRIHGVKILGDGEISKKISIEASCFSVSAREKLDKAGLKYTSTK